MTRNGSFQTEIGEAEILVEVEWEGYYTPAKLYGPWDNSHPAEGEMNILSVQPVGEWPEGLSNAEFDQIVREEDARLTQQAWDEFWDQERDCDAS